jgi:uncharacterized LabA/DUF88 family protein
MPKYAILIDGGFMTKKLSSRLGRFPQVGDVEAECARIRANPAVTGHDLLRIYFYDARPASNTLTNPIDRSVTQLGSTRIHAQQTSLQQSLELRPDFALRMGEAAVHGWKVGAAALRSIFAQPRPLAAADMVPNIEQKGVDLRIGLDIARLALRGLVDAIVVVTGDSDLVPAFRFARREGIRVYLDHMGHGVKRDLKAHADLVL